MKTAILEQFTATQTLVSALTDGEYMMKQHILSGASIGQHVRHVLEFYICLTEGVETGVLCYDNRTRDIRIETDRSFVDQLIDSLSACIRSYDQNKPLKLHTNFALESTDDQWLDTNLFRELAYNLEHGIHHHALIKIGVRHINRSELLDEKFGVAQATIRYHLENLSPAY